MENVNEPASPHVHSLNTHTPPLAFPPPGVCALMCRSAASQCAYTCTLLNDSGRREEMGGKGRKQEGGSMGEKKVGRAHTAAHACVCVCVRERERDDKRGNGRQHHPPRLGEGEGRQHARPSNRQRWKESGHERQT